MDELIDLLEAEQAAIVELGSEMTDEEWELPTRLPGWTVKDNLSHLVGAWNMLLARPRPDHEPPVADHVRNGFARWMEIDVDLRRSKGGREVLAEYRELGAEAIVALRADPDRERIVDAPMGSKAPLGPMLEIVIFDQWTHEQDIRSATGRPPTVDGPVAEHSRDAILGGFRAKLGANPAAAGRSVAFRIDEITSAVRVGSEGPVDHDGPVDVTLRMNLETATELGCGRGHLDDARSRVETDGDEDLARTVLADLTFTS